jgi:Protein of unknown function (DUF1064)
VRRLTVADARALLLKGVPSPAKYHNKRGERYDSVREARRALELSLLAKQGEISNLREHVRYLLVPRQVRADGSIERPVFYEADFVYTLNGATVVEDTKGKRTREYILKRKLMLLVHRIEIQET